MFFKTDRDSKAQVTTGQALAHLMVFQLKLGADALRDLAFSPISVLVFIIDAVRKPALEDSLYLRMMLMGRRSDKLINLFDEYTDSDHYTVDETLSDVEQALWREFKKEQARRLEKQQSTSAVEETGEAQSR